MPKYLTKNIEIHIIIIKKLNRRQEVKKEKGGWFHKIKNWINKTKSENCPIVFNSKPENRRGAELRLGSPTVFVLFKDENGMVDIEKIKDFPTNLS